jgi:alkanesulfonate monooxygenase SsuD/methylene tetrahydromethanopterin reductase-like flavin-dependent oxidoreductase (luciferase family)
VQEPHPPIYLSATGIDSHRTAGELGVAVMTGNTALGWDYVEACVEAYRARAGADGRIALFSTGVNVAASAARAKRTAARIAVQWMETIMGLYANISELSPDYAYLGEIRKLQERYTDVDFLVESSPYVTMGTPALFVERAHRLAELGVDEWILRIDGMGHEENCRAIRMLGDTVIPAVHALERRAAA